MTSLTQTLRQYIAIDDDTLNDILSYFKPLHLAKGDYLVKSEQICTQLAYVNNGLLRTWYTAKEQEVTHWISDEGYFDTALSSFTYKTPSRWNLQAITDCELFVIECDAHQHLMAKYAAWMAFENHALVYAYLGLEERMFSHLYMTAQERYDKLLTERPALIQKAPQQYLASMLGITPETLSRLRKKQTERIS